MHFVCDISSWEKPERLWNISRILNGLSPSVAISPDSTGVQCYVLFKNPDILHSGLNETPVSKGVNRKPASKRIHVSQNHDY